LPAEENDPTVIWKGTGPVPTFNVLSGSVGVAVEAGQQGIVNNLRASGGQVQCGPGTTLATVEVSGCASLRVASPLSTLSQTGGEVSIVGSAGATTINLKGGRLDYRSSGTIANLNIDGEDALA